MTDIARAEVVRAARDTAYDDYAAALLAPAGPMRDDLMTVAAYLGELARIPLQVSDPVLGEIRLQWWRDALTDGAGAGHPIAEAMTGLLARHSIPLHTVLAPLEVRAAELYPDVFPDDAAFEAYAVGGERAHLMMRRHIVQNAIEGGDVSAASVSAPDDLQERGARVLGLTRLLVRLPHVMSRGRWPLPGPRLGLVAPDDAPSLEDDAVTATLTGITHDARQSLVPLIGDLRRIKPQNRLIFLPLALAGPYLRVLERGGHDLLRDIAELQPMARLGRLWLAARWGRF